MALYLGLLPAGEVDVVAEEVGHALLRHLTLQRLQQVCKPLKGLRLRTQPVEVDLRVRQPTTVASLEHTFLYEHLGKNMTTEHKKHPCFLVLSAASHGLHQQIVMEMCLFGMI